MRDPKTLFDRTASGGFWCVPTAVAMATDITYSAAEALIQHDRVSRGEKRALRPVRGVDSCTTGKVLRQLGHPEVRIPLIREGGPWRVKLRDLITSGTFRGRMGRVSLGWHTLLVHDYMVFDNLTARWTWFADYRYIRRRAVRAWEVR